jgi:hypothetical protein
LAGSHVSSENFAKEVKKSKLQEKQDGALGFPKSDVLKIWQILRARHVLKRRFFRERFSQAQLFQKF